MIESYKNVEVENGFIRKLKVRQETRQKLELFIQHH